MRPPFFRTLDALAVDNGRGRAGLSVRLLAHGDIERVMHALERSVPIPQIEILEHGGARREVLRQRPPLATGAEKIEHRVHHLAHVGCPRPPTALGRTDVWGNQFPLLVGQVGRITQTAPLVPGSGFGSPHAAPRESMLPRESQPTPATQAHSERTLRFRGDYHATGFQLYYSIYMRPTHQFAKRIRIRLR